MASHNSQQAKYVYELPFMVNRELCKILDQNDKWEELGGTYMGYKMLDILNLRRKKSPTEELLCLWGQKNHTINELFVLLSKMQHHQALIVLKPFIDSKYHVLINEGEENISRLIGLISEKHQTALHPHPQTSPASNAMSMEVNGNQNFNINEANTIPANKYEEKILNIPQPNAKSSEIPNASAYPQQGGSNVKTLANKEKETISIQPHATTSTRRESECSSIFSEAMGGSIPQITYKELATATNNWDQKNILGRGGFGVVFQGSWKNTQVAIKRIEQRGGSEGAGGSYQAQLEQSSKELKILNSIRHDNVLPLYGFSVGGEHPCLVYQLMPNGSLEDRLQCRRDSPPLTWLQRHKIALGTACGLQFLHTLGDKPLIHGDIKSANILLDANLQPRIGDFGLAREGPIAKYTHIKLTKVQGTKPYLPWDFIRSKQISTKVDTYSFGIVLFEIASGQRAFDGSRNPKLLVDLIKHTEPSQLQNILMDPRLQRDPYNMTSGVMIFHELVTLGQKCIAELPKDRPEMEVVLKEMKNLEEQWHIVSRANSLVHSPSPCPSNPLEVQMMYDALSQQRRTSLGMELPWNGFGESGMGSHRIPSPRFRDSLRVDIPNHEMACNFLPSPHRLIPSPRGIPLASPSIAIEFPSSSNNPSTQPTMTPFHTPSPTPSPYNLPYIYTPIMPTNVQPNLRPPYQNQQPVSPSNIRRQKSPLLEDQQQQGHGIMNMIQPPSSESQSNTNIESSTESSVLLPTTIPRNSHLQMEVYEQPNYSSSYMPDLTALCINDNKTDSPPPIQSAITTCSNQNIDTGELPNLSMLGFNNTTTTDSRASLDTSIQRATSNCVTQNKCEEEANTGVSPTNVHSNE